MGQAEALINLSHADIMTGDYAHATAALDQAGAIAKDLGDRHLHGWVLAMTGIAQRSFSGRSRSAVA